MFCRDTRFACHSASTRLTLLLPSRTEPARTRHPRSNAEGIHYFLNLRLFQGDRLCLLMSCRTLLRHRHFIVYGSFESCFQGVRNELVLTA